jgi:hypothetical protein
MTIALLTSSASHASASGLGVNLGWGDCGGLPASFNMTSLCNSNFGTYTLVGSFVAPSGVTAASANEITMDMQTSGATLPPWWELRTGLCRSASLSANVDFTGGPFTCYDYWQGGSSFGIVMDNLIGNRARIRLVVALPAGSPLITSIPEKLEVYSFKTLINSAKTTGLGACAGCQEGATIVLTSIRINQPVGTPGGNILLALPASRNYVTWQSGLTPTRNATWGSIKALYR